MLSLSALTGGALQGERLGTTDVQALRVDYQLVGQYPFSAVPPALEHTLVAGCNGTAVHLRQLAARLFVDAVCVFVPSSVSFRSPLPAYLLYGALLFYDCGVRFA